MSYFNSLIKAVLLVFLFLSMTPLYADGGILLWAVSAQACFGSSFLFLGSSKGLVFLALIVQGCFILGIVIVVEIVVVERVLRLRYRRAKKMSFWVVTKGNVFSTIIGAVISFIIIFLTQKSSPEDKGTAGIYLGSCVLFFLISFLVEYRVARPVFGNIRGIKQLKKAFLVANIVTYFIPTLIMSLFYIGLWIMSIIEAKTIHTADLSVLVSNIMITVGTVAFLKRYMKQEVE